MYVPQDDREDLGEVHISLSPTTGIQSVERIFLMHSDKKIMPN
jgi:hypothetical protein